MQKTGISIKYTLAAVMLLLTVTISAQQSNGSFTSEWKKIDSLILEKNLTRTALERVKQLHKEAVALRLSEQVIKAALYRLSLEDRITTNDPTHAISLLNAELAASRSGAERAIYYSLLARHYLQYFYRNRWQLYGRTNTKDFVKGDITTWTADDLLAAARTNFLISLQDRQLLQQIKLEGYEAIIIKGNSRSLRPTLFDLLAHEALDFFKSAEGYSIRPVNTFVMSSISLLQPAEDFITAKLSNVDTSSMKWQGLKIFQQLLQFHAADADKNALVMVDLDRLQWVYNQAVIANKTALYEKALRDITERYPQLTATKEAWVQLANLAVNRAVTYTPGGDTSVRYEYIKALEYISRGTNGNSDTTQAAASLRNLRKSVLRQELQTEIERVNVPGKPMRALVSYRNTDTAFFRIVQLAGNDFIRERKSEPNYWSVVAGRKAIREFYQVLPAVGDHQQHSTEIKIDALPTGEYAILVSSGAHFNEAGDHLSLQSFYVSNLSYIRSGNDYFVLHRETGKPLPAVKIKVMSDRFISTINTRISEVVAERFSDEHGHFRFIPARNLYSIHFFLSTDTDSLNLLENGYVTMDNQPEQELPLKMRKQLYLFTDRGIYRPGQVVLFKGIAVEKNVKSNTSSLQPANDATDVFLLDVNQKKVDSIRAVLNSYGSFTGRFQLPMGGLTGNYSISAPGFGSTHKFISVEEYKRPLFSVQFQPVKGDYRLNDSITVSGIAKAFAGNKVDGAQVSYRVTRNIQYLMPWLMRRPDYSSREITQGTTTTDAEGKFTVKFKALADDITDSAGNPIFVFNVQADVTDRNGETHSQSTAVRTGYQNLELRVTTAPITMADSARLILVNTSNFSNEPVPGQVRLTIFPLQAPDRPVKKRYWARPDQYVMSKKEFLRSFPTDEYENETEFQNWSAGGSIMEKQLESNGNGEWKIPANALAAGFYKWEAVATTRNGKEIRQLGYFQVFDKRSDRMPASGFNFSFTDKLMAEPGETVHHYSGIPVDHLFVISRQAGTKTPFEYNYLKKGINTLSYEVTEKDRGDILIQRAFVYDNRIYTNTVSIAVPWTNKTLKLTYSSYRNLTEPGAKEKWTVTVQGNKSDSVTAELLTGMYDASLDQFSNNTWGIPPVWQLSAGGVAFNGQLSFGKANNQFGNYRNEQYHAPAEITYDRLASSGAELWRERLVRIMSDMNVSPALREAAQQQYNSSLTMDQDAWPTAGKDLQRAGAGLVAHDALLSETMVAKQSRALPGVLSYNKTVLADAQIAGTNAGGPLPLYVVNGVIVRDINSLNASTIKSIATLSPAEAQAMYGAAGINGALILTVEQEGVPVKPRTNLAETAFFFPQLYADSTGKFTFNFTMPEGLTQWKWQSLAHTRDLAFGVQRATIVTQKKLMVQPNAPRFMREGDNMEFSGKIVNLTDKEITGQASLELVDPSTNSAVDGWFQNVFPSQYFTIGAGQSTAVKFPIQIPFSYNKPLTWRLVARSADMSDGEENTLPVLTNRVLVTETLPLYMPSDSTRTFSFDKLLHTNSESLTNESLTVEYTSNPVWYAVQALSYLIDYPYECAEQTFNRYYANTLAGLIVNKNPRLKAVFEEWKKDSTALLANLQKNQELKQVLLQETPWVMQAESEAQQKKNLALLFDRARVNSQADVFLQKLADQQTAEGGFSWFKGGNTDRYITNYILTGIGKLKRLGALPQDLGLRLRGILVKAVQYMDQTIGNDYEQLLKSRADMNKPHTGNRQLEYLYMRSFFNDLAQQSKTAYGFYLKQSRQFWATQSSYYKAMTGIIAIRNNDEAFARNTVLPAILENSSTDTRQGMYWKSAYTGWWYQSPVEHQSLMIAFASELDLAKPSAKQVKDIDAMKTWLLLNKQTNNWRTTIATADACYALLLNGSNWMNSTKKVSIQLGNITLPDGKVKTEAGSGYFKQRIEGRLVDPKQGNITVTTTDAGVQGQSSQPSWGAVYWQYFEDMDKVTAAASPLSLNKKLFIEKNTDKGKILQAVRDGDELNIGDKVVARIELRSDRDMDYLHLKDMRAASMEPVNVLSGYKWQGGLGYYESTRDASTNFFIDHLTKGTYVFEYPLFITHSGVFSAGIATIQCMYAPEFSSHSEGIKLRVATR